MKVLNTILFFIAILLIAISCQTKPADTGAGVISATDSRNKTIYLEQPAQRVMVLFAPMVDQVYMLQAGTQLIAIPEQVYLDASTFDALSQLDERIASKSLATPSFGGSSANLESVVRLKPDLAIVYEFDSETITQLEDLGIPVFSVSSKDKESIYAELIGVARLMGKEKRAEELIHYTSEELKKMGDVSVGGKKKIYYAWSKGRIFSTSGKGSLVDLAIESAGADNACPLNMQAANIGAELIYQWNPDLIILWNSEPADVYKLKELAALPAVKSKQVFELSPTFNFDPHTLKFLVFAKQLRQWCYPDPNYSLKEEVNETLAILYGQKLK